MWAIGCFVILVGDWESAESGNGTNVSSPASVKPVVGIVTSRFWRLFLERRVRVHRLVIIGLTLLVFVHGRRDNIDAISLTLSRVGN